MSRVHPQQQPYVSAYYRPAGAPSHYAPVMPAATMDRREYAINTPATYMAWPVYPNTAAMTAGAPTPVVTNPMHVFPARSRSLSARSKPSRSSSRSRPQGEEGSSGYNTTNSRENSVGRNHSIHDFFSLRRSRSSDSRKSGKSGKSGISSKSLGEYVSGMVQMMNPFGGPRGRSKSRDRGDFTQDWYTPATPYNGKKLVKSHSTRRPARVPTYESAPAPGSLQRSNTTNNVTHHHHHRQSRPTERRVEREVDHHSRSGHSHGHDHSGVEERESRSRSRPRAFTPAELQDQATTRRGLQDWIEGRMQEEAHARDIQQPTQKIQTFQPAWRASTSSYANKHTNGSSNTHGVKHPNVTAGIGVPKTSVPPTSKYTREYTYNGYHIRV